MSAEARPAHAQHASPDVPARPAPRLLVVLVVTLATLTAAVLTGYSAAQEPRLTVGAAALVALTALVVRRPATASYVYLAVCPLIVGLDRGFVVPLLRLNEALLAALWVGLVLGPLRRWALRGFPRPDIRPLDLSVLALAVFSSVTSLLWMYARGIDVGLDDALYALALWKSLALWILVRTTIRTPTQMRRAAAIVVGVSVIVGSVGLAQALGITPVIDRLIPFSSEEDAARAVAGSRASSTIGGSIPFGDIMIMAGVLSYLLADLTRRVVGVGLRLGAGALAVAGIASGQVSAIVGVLIAAAVLGRVTRKPGRILLAMAVLGFAAYHALQPVFAARLDQVDPRTGVPTAWTGEYGRTANLTTYIWPRIGEDMNWLLGVQTSARIPAPEPWRQWVYVESGYAWLLWNGGVPLLLAFLAFLVLGLKTSALAAGGPSDTHRVIGRASLTSLVVLAVLMVLDPHLTYRGASDVLMPLVAMAATAASSTGRGTVVDPDERPSGIPAPSGSA